MSHGLTIAEWSSARQGRTFQPIYFGKQRTVLASRPLGRKPERSVSDVCLPGWHTTRFSRGQGWQQRSDTLSLQGEHTVQPLVQTPFQELNAEISPDGRWLAYQSNESGRFEIYVRPFPNVNDARWQVSSSGGSRPVWAQGGRELFYVSAEGEALMTVPVKGGPTFQSGAPAKLLDTGAYYFPPAASGSTGDPGRTYDVSRDGSRFLMIKTGTVGDEAAGPQSITVVVNWLEELRQLVPRR